MNKTEYENWLRNFRDDVREACKAFKEAADWPKAWLLLDGEEPDEWYEPEDLLGLPVYRTRAHLEHSGHDGEHQTVIPLWLGDVSNANYATMRREFEARLAKSGDF
jgi:hypothetical protein